jgi:hypothetical protein
MSYSVFCGSRGIGVRIRKPKYIPYIAINNLPVIPKLFPPPKSHSFVLYEAKEMQTIGAIFQAFGEGKSGGFWKTVRLARNRRLVGLKNSIWKIKHRDSHVFQWFIAQICSQNAPENAYKCFGFTYVSYREGAYQVEKMLPGYFDLKIVSFDIQVQPRPLLRLHQFKLRFRKCQAAIGGISGILSRTGLFRDGEEGQQNSPSRDSLGPTEHSVPTWQVPCGVVCAFIAIFTMFTMGRWGNRPSVELGAFLLILIAGFLILMGYIDGEPNDSDDSNNVLPSQNSPQHGEMVPQKHLDPILLLGYSYSSESSHQQGDHKVPDAKPKPKKVGRPALPKGSAKAAMLRIRVTPGELRSIEASARTKKQTVSEWIRSTLEAKPNG